MLLFCPLCGNMLTITRGPPEDEFPTGRHRMQCRTCPYIYTLEANETLYERKYMKAKEVEDVMGGAEAWKTAAKTSIQCAKEGCDGDKAYFKQVQLRSADEPMTLFYNCVTCGHQWREQ